MDISYSFDDNDVRVDEPLGSVVISEGDCRLRADTVFLDAFFSALVYTYARSRKEGVGTVEVEGERDTLHFERLGDNLKLTYAQQEIVISNSIELEQSLVRACAKLLGSFPTGTGSNELFGPVQRFVAQHSGLNAGC